jgi:lysophospholipase L1-like esterase
MCSLAPRARAGLALAALLLACGVKTGGSPPDALAPQLIDPPPPERAIFFGSSTTAGSGATRPERRWTTLVSRRLGWIEVNRGLSTSTLTELGRKTPSAERRWREAIAGAPADVVVVMYGANDVLARVPLGDPETPGTFRHAARQVLHGIREALPDAALVVCAPQPSRATAERREPYDLALAEATAREGGQFIAAGSAFPEERLGELAADRLHLNDAGHAVLAEFVLSHRGTLGARTSAARVATR